MADDVNELLDTLYRAAPAEFVALRNDAVKALKAEGRKEEAAEFKSLKRPSTAAWVVNQLHFRHGPDVEALIAANEALRTAHQTPGANIQEVMEQRRSRMDALLVVVRDLLEAGGFAQTREQMRRVNRTLETATTSDENHELGRLFTDLEPAGFGALSGLAFSASASGKRKPKSKGQAKPSRTKKATTKTQASTTTQASTNTRAPAKAKKKGRDAEPETDDKAAQQWAAEARLKVEEKKLERAERQATLAETAHLAAGRYIERASAKIDELNERLAQANEVLDQAKADAVTKREYLDDAKHALERAEKRVQEATDAVDLARS